MNKPKSIKELLASGGKRLENIKVRATARNLTLEHVRAALPGPLGEAVISAEIADGKLTVGVAGGAWATRLRYVTETLGLRVATSLGQEITAVRIKVIPPQP